MGSREGVIKSWQSRSRKRKDYQKISTSKKLIGNKNASGAIRSLEFRRNVSLKMVGNKYGAHELTEEHKLKISEAHIKRREGGSIYRKRTLGELAVRSALEFLNFNFEEQARPIKINRLGTVDFWLPDKHLAIEVDGWYHSFPNQRLKDAVKDRIYKEAGFRVLRILREKALSGLENVVSLIQEAIHAS